MKKLGQLIASALMGMSICCGNLPAQTYSIAITPTMVINPKAKMLTGISFDARASAYYSVGTGTATMGYFSPSTGTVLPGMQPHFNRMPVNGVRYPGNPCVMGWNWHYTIGPVASRTPQALGMPSQTLAFGFDEFMNMVSAKGLPYSEVQIMVNLYSSIGEPNPAILAADWVEYCNAPNNGSNPRGGIDWAALRAANGHTVPYGVKIWNVGNEPWGASEFGSTAAGASSYIAVATPIIDSMLKVDPSIQITLPVVSLNSSPWNSTILSSSIATKAWGLSPHYFYDNDISTSNPNISQCHTQMISQAAAAKAKNLKLVLGDNGHDCPATDQDRGMRWRGGISTADFLLAASQVDNVDRANYWIFGSPKNVWHPIRNNGNGSFTFMSVAQLYETFGAKFLDKSVLTSVVDTSGAGVNQARAAAFFSNNGLSANVIIINTDSVANKKVIAPVLSGMTLQKALQITAPALNSDTTTSTIITPLYNSTYKLSASGVLILEYANTSGVNQITSLANNHIGIYPNPANDVLYFSEELSNIEIYNSLGQKVLTQIPPGRSISISGLTEGIYFIKSGMSMMKFVVKR